MAYKLPRIEAAIQMVDNVSATMRPIRQSLEATNATVEKLRNSMGSLVRESRLDKLAASAGALRGKLGGVADGFGQSFGRLQGVLLGGGGVVAGTGLFLGKVADTADAIYDTSKRIGVATDTLQKFRYAAQLSGSSIETADGALERFAKGLSAARAGSGEALGPLQAMGIRLRNSAGQARSMEDVLLDISDAMAKIPNEQDRLRASSALFGKGNQAFVASLEKGSKSLAETFAQFRSAGGPISTEDLEKAAAYNDSVDRMKFAAAGLASTFAVQLFPTVTALLEKFTAWGVANREGIANAGKWVATNLPGFVDKLASSFSTLANQVAPFARALGWAMDTFGPFQVLATGLTVFIAGPFVMSVLQTIPALFSMGRAIFATGRILWGLTAALRASSLAFLVSPFGLWVAGIAAVGAAVFLLWKNWDTVSGWLTTAWGAVGAFLDTTAGKIMAVFVFPLIGIPLLIIRNWKPLKAFFADLWDGATERFQEFADFVGRLWDKIAGVVGKGAGMISSALSGIPGFGLFGGGAPPMAAQGAPVAASAAAAVRDNTNTTTSTILQRSSIAVDFRNLPPGARVSEPIGNAPVSVTTGMAFGAGGF